MYVLCFCYNNDNKLSKLLFDLIFTDNETTDIRNQRKRKFDEEVIIVGMSSNISHKSSDKQRIEKEVIDLSIEKDDSIINKIADNKHKQETKTHRITEPELSAIFYNNNDEDAPEDSYHFAKVIYVKIGEEQICSFETFIDIMSVESKFLIRDGARKALEEILDDVNLSLTESKEINIFPVFERHMKEYSRRFMTDLLKTTVLVTKS